MASEQSAGQLLFAQGCKQGAVYLGSSFPAEIRKKAVDTRNDVKRRGSKAKHEIQDGDLLVVISQDCDIAYKSDSDEPLIEAALFKTSKPHDNNNYAASVRTLNIKWRDSTFSAQLKDIVWLEKPDLLKIQPADVLDDDTRFTLKTWRANRYIREPFPDAFNELFSPTLKNRHSELYALHHCIRGIYIALNNYEENPKYQVALLAIVSHDITREDFSRVLQCMEEWCNALDATGRLQDVVLNEIELVSPRGVRIKLELPVMRETEITVATLSAFRKFNMDYISLSQGDKDLDAIPR